MNAPSALPTELLHAIDADPQETAEWHEAFLALLQQAGPARARQLLDGLAGLAAHQGVGWKPSLNTPYVNTIPADRQPPFPGDLAIEERLASLMRWNALAMVVRANTAYGELGGHIASYASAADLFETGFNHFFRAGRQGDLVFFQPHSAPGVYARAYLEGRLSEHDLLHYRQEITAEASGTRGLSSYPHPWLMPDFWQFPTGSMGLGPISSIYHARFMRYLAHRGLQDTAGRTVWGVFGDGEMDEPESMSALTLAAREKLDNLVWVVNCNLQRLDGPVRGNGRIIDELERLFAGAGWNVIKLVWGSDWDGLFARDHSGALLRALGDTVDGQMQTFAAKDGRFNRDHFFGQNPELAALAQGMTDEQIDRLKRGGHDLVKIHAAYAAAAAHRGQPTVILAHTKKGYGMGTAGQGKMTTHSQKKLDETDLIEFRNRFNLPLTDEQATSLSFYKPAADSPEMQYLHARRAALGGHLPRRDTTCEPVAVPPLAGYGQFALAAGGSPDCLAVLLNTPVLKFTLTDAVPKLASPKSSQSLPAPPSITSLPEPPLRRSSPWPPKVVVMSSVVTMKSWPSPPRIRLPAANLSSGVTAAATMAGAPRCDPQPTGSATPTPRPSRKTGRARRSKRPRSRRPTRSTPMARLCAITRRRAR